MFLTVPAIILTCCFCRFLCKIDVLELGGSDEICGKGSDLTLFLFSDVLEISKKKRHPGIE